MAKPTVAASGEVGRVQFGAKNNGIPITNTEQLLDICQSEMSVDSF